MTSIANLLGIPLRSGHRISERDSYRESEDRRQPRYSAEPLAYDDDYEDRRSSHRRRESHRSDKEDRTPTRPRRQSRHSSTRSRGYDDDPYPSGSGRDRDHTRPRDDGRSIRRRETLPDERPSSSTGRRHTIDNYFSYASPIAEEYHGPGDHTSHRDMYSNARPPTPPVLDDGTIVPPLRRRQTDSAALDRRSREVAKEIWEEDPYLRPGSRTIELPSSEGPRMMPEATWFGGEIDRKLATQIAFTDVDYADERKYLSQKQQDEFTRCYFPNLKTYRTRVGAQTATSLREFDDIFTGMKESVLRGVVYTALAGIRPLSIKAISRPDQDPLYMSFKLHLENYVDDVKSEWRKRPESYKSEQWAIDRLRAKYGDFGTSRPAIEGRKRSQRSSRYRDEYD